MGLTSDSIANNTQRNESLPDSNMQNLVTTPGNIAGTQQDDAVFSDLEGSIGQQNFTQARKYS